MQRLTAGVLCLKTYICKVLKWYQHAYNQMLTAKTDQAEVGNTRIMTDTDSGIDIVAA